ncbi:MAG: cytidine deaminase [Pseudomonadota bacterium]
MSKSIDDLIEAAAKAQAAAYAPYSDHPVGAAILDDLGDLYTGCNVENAAFPEGVCAEASAISAMVLAGGRRIEAIAVIGPGPALCTPCGGCRQKIREFGQAETLILICGPEGLEAEFSLDELLPASFGPENMG